MIFLFWVLYIVSAAFGIWSGHEAGQPYPFTKWGALVMVYILIGILGYEVFHGLPK